MKEGDNVATFDITKRFMNNMLAIKFKLSMSKRGVIPSVSFNTSQLSPLHCKIITLIFCSRWLLYIGFQAIFTWFQEGLIAVRWQLDSGQSVRVLNAFQYRGGESLSDTVASLSRVERYDNINVHNDKPPGKSLGTVRREL